MRRTAHGPAKAGHYVPPITRALHQPSTFEPDFWIMSWPQAEPRVAQCRKEELNHDRRTQRVQAEVREGERGRGHHEGRPRHSEASGKRPALAPLDGSHRL